MNEGQRRRKIAVQGLGEREMCWQMIKVVDGWPSKSVPVK